MTKNEYANILNAAIRLQIAPYKEYLDKYESECESNDFVYREGIVRGLEIALEKIEASMFLCEE